VSHIEDVTRSSAGYRQEFLKSCIKSIIVLKDPIQHLAAVAIV